MALYPAPIANSLMLAVDKERVAAINFRILESVSVFDSDYREIGIVINDDESFCLHDMDEVMEFVIILYLLSNAPKDTVKVRMKVQNFGKELLEKNKNEMEKLFQKYSFELMMRRFPTDK